MLNFEEAMESVEEGGKPSILLGNGFSRAWREDIFNYENLFLEANFGEQEEPIRAIFDHLGTYDFEAVSRALVSAQIALEAYGGDQSLLAEIVEGRKKLKDALISAISHTHPDRPSAVDNAEFTVARQLVTRFSQIFTVNYDLLLYWARNMVDLQPAEFSSDDGFRVGGTWQGADTNQNVHFLHGGLHIFDSGDLILKHTYSHAGVSIIDLVRDNLEAERFPLFVSEPTADLKKERIEHNPYLNYCYRALRKVRGTFFILGHSIDENDKHIFDALKSSNINQYFVGIYGDESSDQNTRVKANAIAFLDSVTTEVKFFDAETVPIWSPVGADNGN